jgi:enamine deaminase RidA (YjgF/YER057c/UK114 family)
MTKPLKLGPAARGAFCFVRGFTGSHPVGTRGECPRRLAFERDARRRVFITDARYGDRLTQLRREIFGDNFPGSALITVTALAIPEAKVEIQGYAVIGSK